MEDGERQSLIMSACAMAAVWDLDTQSPVEKLVLLCIADNCGDENYCEVTMAHLCNRTSLSELVVWNSLQGMAFKGWIGWIRGRHEHDSMTISLNIPEYGLEQTAMPV